MNQSKSKVVLITVALVALLVASVVLFVLSSKKSTPVTQSPKPTTQSNAIIIDNQTALTSYTDTKTIDDAQIALYSSVKINTTDPVSTYHGTVREWSIRLTTTNGNPVTTFMVDIPSLKQSYQVTINGTVGSDYRALNVFCPSAQQLVYPSFNCQEAQ